MAHCLTDLDEATRNAAAEAERLLNLARPVPGDPRERTVQPDTQRA